MGEHKDRKNQTRKIVTELWGAFQLLDGVTGTYPNEAFKVTFALLAYKRFSDAKIIIMPDSCGWNQLINDPIDRPVDQFFAELDNNYHHIQAANKLPDIGNALELKQLNDRVPYSVKKQLITIFEGMDLSSTKYSTAQMNEIVNDFIQLYFSEYRFDTFASENKTLNRLALALLDPRSNEKLYFPQCGVGDVIIQAFDHYVESSKVALHDLDEGDDTSFKASGSVHNPDIWAITVLRILMAEINWVEIKNDDFLSYWPDKDSATDLVDALGDLLIKSLDSRLPYFELGPAKGRSFIGRKGIINEILKKIVSNNNVIVVGPHGSGKTSLALRLCELIPQRLDKQCIYEHFINIVEGAPPFEAISIDLFQQNQVLIIDDFEQVNVEDHKNKLVLDLIKAMKDRGILIILLSAEPLTKLLEGFTDELKNSIRNLFRQHELDPLDFDLPEPMASTIRKIFADKIDQPCSRKDMSVVVAATAGLIKISNQTFIGYDLEDSIRVAPFLADVICFTSPPVSLLPNNITATMTHKDQIFEISSSHMEFFSLFLAMKFLFKKGRIGIILPTQSLHQEVESLGLIRKFLIDEDLLEAIVQLPYLILPLASPNLVLMIINTEKSKEKKKKVAFINVRSTKKDGIHVITSDSINKANYVFKNFTSLSNNYIATAEEIKQRNYNLLPSRYVGPIAVELRRIRRSPTGNQLGEISRVIRGSSFGKSDNLEGIPVIYTKDLSKDVKELYLAFDDVWFADPLISTNPIKERCIIVSLVGKELKPTIFDPEITEETYGYREILLGKNVAAIFPDDEIVDFDYLYYQLNSSLIKTQFEENLAGAGIPNINLPRLKQIIIPVLDKLEDQRSFTYQQKTELLKAENAKYEALRERLKIDEEKQTSQYEVLGFVAHTIKNDMPIAIATIDRIKSFLEERDLLGQQIFETQSAGDLLEKADKALQQINNVVKNVRDLVSREFKRVDFQEVNICELFENELKPLMKKDYISMIVKCDIIEPIKIHKEAFIWAISNILNNAETHGFPNFVDGAEVRFDIQTNEKEMVIDYRNNGLPLPSDINTHNYTGFGTKSRGSKGYGLGGAIVSRVIKDVHNGTLELIHDKNAIHLRMTIPLGD